jgi:alkylation response protein AidB-like acyl-CoA dehydrogenase
VSPPADPVDDLVAWLELNWDPDLTVAAWWERLGRSGWAAPMLPPQRYGRGLSRGDALRVTRVIADFGALGPPVGLGLGMAAPTIAVHGTDEQVERLVGGIVTGQRAWCQLFSEPGAGSDLAGLATRAVPDGALWMVNGQKVWTSGGDVADLGMLLARTDPDAPKHQGLTWFALDMHQKGVELRPLRQMTGATNFNEVFLTDAVVEDANRIGEVNNGWAVANTTLHFERSSMGSGGGAGSPPFSAALPGTVAGHLGRRAGEFAPRRRRSSERGTAPARPVSPAAGFIELARTFGKDRDPLVRQGLARLHVLRELARMNTERQRAAVEGGSDIAGIANFSKLLMADIVRLNRDLGLQILGPRGTLHAYDDAGRADLRGLVGGEAASSVTAQALGAQALPIFGGTDQIQRNIISERALGMPKEPGDLSAIPWSELPKNV